MASRTFAEASKEIQASLKKHLEKLPQKEKFSDESDDESDEANGENRDALLDRVFQSYDVDVNQTGSRTRDALIGSLQRGTGDTSCLICISGLKRADPIWSCQSCFCSFHLQCIQRWGRDNIFQQKNELENSQSDSRLNQKDINNLKWGCPKCRHTYTEREIPSRYECFCGKVTDPPVDPWLVPHSCGDPCSKQLQPECGHHCVVLCHPGPCPPCPKMLLSNCFCGQTAPAQRRCFDKGWSCRKPCSRTLNCGQHKCPKPCHQGECPPCEKKSIQLCQCKRNKRECDCATPNWQCKEPCGRPLGCGHHLCDLVCHEGACPPCPLSQLRSCPCGKSKHQLPCTEATPTCFDTCGKILACGNHVCSERCHRGTCGSCLEMVVKRCRCGAKQKEMICAKEFICDLKCKNLRDCRKHTCNKKCCDGTNCLSCEQQCNKTLACKNHKCSSRCHQGACYPCTLTKEVACFCGSSRILVPCGMERNARPPKCKKSCGVAPDCHHPSRVPHACHFGDCPTCRQVCHQEMKCGHLCPAPCHDRVLVKVDPPSKNKAATPWEETRPLTEVRSMPCPDCQYPVPVTCLGNHETADWPCSAARAGPCGRVCGRRLACGNHVCQRPCHRVKNAPNEVVSGSNCRKCEAECQRPRPDGCPHPCLKPCHVDPCDQCTIPIRIRCHCGMAQLFVKCEEWITAKEDSKKTQASCQDQCPKLMTCGHRCFLKCHPGDCGEPSECRKKIKLTCPCKRLKRDVACQRAATESITCDAECQAIKLQAQKAEREAEARQREEEERQQREEAERQAKKLAMADGKRKQRRNRRAASENVEASFWEKWRMAILIMSTVLIGGLAYYAMKM